MLEVHMNPEEVDELLKKLQEDWPIIDVISFNEFNIQDKLQNASYQLMVYHEQYIKAKSRMDELIDIKNRAIGKKYDELRFNSDKSLTGKEIENYYLPRDKDIRKINAAIAKQQVIVNYFEACTKAIDKLNWNIKLFIDDRRIGG